ncbi:helix-turn-helix domain-containing protein [Ktedonobacter racemifer]|uniref:Transposase IS3/IS911 family protein n=1 Tax=Ktedonobacter racemifer DSM 44963 TaxID=485913 RepID=D6TTC0_KTERA|nr:helix-turn-helix domain-containing protein [Ktedonobacter racemifer]EFH83671.1 transposase IS3/IS911 family protein [Ktedonobacter racemifer DSM 44963]
MTKPPIPLTALSEAQRAQATQRFTIIRSALEDGVTQTQVASTHNISVSTVRRWVKRYREKGFAGLADAKGEPPGFVATKAWRRFAEICDGCRRTRVVGLGYGPPGTGKNEELLVTRRFSCHIELLIVDSEHRLSCLKTVWFAETRLSKPNLTPSFSRPLPADF